MTVLCSQHVGPVIARFFPPPPLLSSCAGASVVTGGTGNGAVSARGREARRRRWARGASVKCEM